LLLHATPQGTLLQKTEAAAAAMALTHLEFQFPKTHKNYNHPTAPNRNHSNRENSGTGLPLTVSIIFAAGDHDNTSMQPLCFAYSTQKSFRGKFSLLLVLLLSLCNGAQYPLILWQERERRSSVVGAFVPTAHIRMWLGVRIQLALQHYFVVFRNWMDDESMPHPQVVGPAASFKLSLIPVLGRYPVRVIHSG
jgi:hypothetical protein